MSVHKTHDLPLVGESVGQFTFASNPAVRPSSAAGTRNRAGEPGPNAPRKFDWFLLLLCAFVALGITAISLLVLMLLTPSTPAPLP